MRFRFSVLSGRTVLFSTLFALPLGLAHAQQQECPCNDPIQLDCGLGADLFIEQPTLFSDLDGSNVDVDGVKNGMLTLSNSLILFGNGSIIANDPAVPAGASAQNITINVCGNIDIWDGCSIYAENRTGSGSGGNINIHSGANITLYGNGQGTHGAIISSSKVVGTGAGVAGNILMDAPGLISIGPGAQVLANSVLSAGAIEMDAGRALNVDGLISSESTLSGTGAKQAPGGGTVTLKTPCNLNVNYTGIIRSKGQDPGADLVHLEGCHVFIGGLVESTGPGHAIPNNPKNHLSSPNRPDKPANSTAGVEVWASESLDIDGVDNSGQINADTGQSGGTKGTGYIDLLCGGNITIYSPQTGPFFAVHANGGNLTNGHGGLIKLQAIGSVYTNGQILQADATGAGGSGGRISVEAGYEATLRTTTISARGDFNPVGGYGRGGAVTVRAYNFNTTWNGTGNVLPTGTGVPAANRGTADVIGCTVKQLPVFPSIGTPTIQFGTDLCVGGYPTFEQYVDIPQCLCGDVE